MNAEAVLKQWKESEQGNEWFVYDYSIDDQKVIMTISEIGRHCSDPKTIMIQCSLSVDEIVKKIDELELEKSKL